METKRGKYARLRALADEMWERGEKDVADMLHKEARKVRQEYLWDEQDYQCTGSGFSHKPHGKCRGYSTDRT